MLDHDPNLLAYGMRVQLNERLQQVGCLGLVVMRIGFDRFEQTPVRLVGRVILQNVQDEAFLDRLTHAVQMKRFELPLRTLGAEQLQGFCLWRRSEGKHREISKASA